MMRKPISKTDEFLLSRLIDGDLPAEAESALRARLETEPELKRRYEALARVNALLAARREQPTLDLRGFRSQVMATIAREPQRASAPVILRLPRWTWVAGPLAAAAAILLLISISARLHHDAARRQLAANPPSAPVVAPQKHDDTNGLDESRMIVQYKRSVPTSPDAIQVSYVRSPQLAEDMRERDDDRQARPSSYLFARARAQSASNGESDLPPL